MSVARVSLGDTQPLMLLGDVEAAVAGLPDMLLSSLETAAVWFLCPPWSSPRSSREMTSVAATSTGVLPLRFDNIALAPRRNNS